MINEDLSDIIMELYTNCTFWHPNTPPKSVEITSISIFTVTCGSLYHDVDLVDEGIIVPMLWYDDGTYCGKCGIYLFSSKAVEHIKLIKNWRNL